MKILISGEHTEYINYFEGLGISVLGSISNELIGHPTSYHSDLQAIRVEDKLFVLKNTSYISSNYEIIKTNSMPSNIYPNDCLLNCLIIANKAFCNKKAIDINLLNYLEENNYKILNVNQGYTKCSSLNFGKNVITSDKSIYKACLENQIKALLISSGSIELHPYDYGFIGGASGVINDTVYFFGDIQTHPSSREIIEFISKANFKIKSIGRGKLQDIGGIVSI